MTLVETLKLWLKSYVTQDAETVALLEELLRKSKKYKLCRIVVNKHVIKANKKDPNHFGRAGAPGKYAAPISCQVSGQRVVAGYRIAIDGPSEVVYNQDKPLKCGAEAWIETRSRVRASLTPLTDHEPLGEVNS